jgi:hypothetical protein
LLLMALHPWWMLRREYRLNDAAFSAVLVQQNSGPEECSS